MENLQSNYSYSEFDQQVFFLSWCRQVARVTFANVYDTWREIGEAFMRNSGASDTPILHIV